ncbi:Ion transport domain-containing protein [Hirschfeldia incana]|nr:Ion transport domain-containing protein [Hirschfeldia incana]
MYYQSRYERFVRGDVVMRPSTLSNKSFRGWLQKMFKKMTTPPNWSKTVLFVCVVALAFDPLFFFIPVIDSHKFCFTLDKKLGTAVCVLRTVIDTFYVIHIIFHFITDRRTDFLRGELFFHSETIRKGGLHFYFTVDIVSVLPIPQVIVLTLVSRKQKTSLVSKEILKWAMFCQYIPRSIRIYPIFKEVTKASGTVAQRKWVGAALNLFFYLLPSHVIGAFWYLIAIEKRDTCWREACVKISGCNLTDLVCARGGGGDNSRFLNTSCPLIDPEQITNSTVFNFGMYIDALKSGVVESRDFPRKLFYCFWWGLRNISALGQNLETSNSVGEILFAIIICVSGVLLFAVLIGNVQKYLQSNTARVDEWEEKKRDTEKWMSYRKLPDNLKKRIRKYEDGKWQETRGTEEEALLRSLPKDIRLETKRHLYMKLLMRVEWLYSVGDDWLLDELCDRVKPVFYSAKSFIVREGDPVKEMLFVTRGELEMGTTCEQCALWAGDLLFFVLDPQIHSLPILKRTVKAATDIEGFTLSADDLEFAASHLKRFHGAKLEHIKHEFRHSSVSSRSWAACYIQEAWRAHCRRKASRILRAEKAKQQIQQDTQLNLGATLYVSRFVSKAMRNRQDDSAECSSFSGMLPVVPHQPADPKFSTEEA